MGLLTEGEPLSWPETAKLSQHVREHGVAQFVNLYHKLKDRRGDVLKWGDEVEYTILKVDDERKEVKVAMRAKEMLARLQEAENSGRKDLPSLWRPEYGSYMVEGTPGVPYGGLIDDFSRVEKNMKARRDELEALLAEDELAVSMTVFPRLGCPSFTFPSATPDPVNSFTKSLFWPNEATFQGHPRFKTLTRNIRMRRGEKVAMNPPVFRDANTPEGLLDDFNALNDADGASRSAAEPGGIYMDAMGFGMGMSCLQVTFQACNVEEAESLYDQLAPLCPILLALTAGAPVFRGWLADVDCRWDVIAGAVDDRTRGERGNGPDAIAKSRYDSISSYLSECSAKFAYNDVALRYDPAVYRRLRDDGVKEAMAKHIAHLFVRDTVSLFSEKVEQDDTRETDHFENIQSTNWQTMRFKPPPPDSPIGWRVEFRPCELQFTDFENAAVVCFVVLITRVILSFGYNLLIPISKVDENMKRAQKRDAVVEQKFFFRTNITTACKADHKPPVVVEMTIDQIINGDSSLNYPGLLPLVHEFLRDQEISTSTMCTLSNYWKLIKLRASGHLKTNARFMRDFIRGHPHYKQDSRVDERICYDLIKTVDAIQKDGRNEELFGDLSARTE